MLETTFQDQEILDNLSLVLENSPVKFQVTKCVEELQPSTFTVQTPPLPPYINGGEVEFLKFGNKGGDEIFFLE